MKDDGDNLVLIIPSRDIGHIGIRDRPSKVKGNIEEPPPFVAKTESRIAEKKESDSPEGDGLKIITPSNITNIWFRLEVLIKLKVSEHTDSLTKASNLIDEL